MVTKLLHGEDLRPKGEGANAEVLAKALPDLAASYAAARAAAPEKGEGAGAAAGAGVAGALEGA